MNTFTTCHHCTTALIDGEMSPTADIVDSFVDTRPGGWALVMSAGELDEWGECQICGVRSRPALIEHVSY